MSENGRQPDDRCVCISSTERMMQQIIRMLQENSCTDSECTGESLQQPPSAYEQAIYAVQFTMFWIFMAALLYYCRPKRNRGTDDDMKGGRNNPDRSNGGDGADYSQLYDH